MGKDDDKKKIKRIFFNNVDTYESNNIAQVIEFTLYTLNFIFCIFHVFFDNVIIFEI